jgi:hypothetical protein
MPIRDTPAGFNCALSFSSSYHLTVRILILILETT